MGSHWKHRFFAYCSAVMIAVCLDGATYADEFTIFLRDLKGNPLPRAELQAFQRRSTLTVDFTVTSAGAIIEKGLVSLIGKKQADANGMINVTINLADPDQRAIVFVGNQKDKPVTAVVPFFVIGAENDLTHRIHMAVPEPQPSCRFVECCDRPKVLIGCGRRGWRHK